MTEEILQVPLPRGFRLRKQNPDCNTRGHLCALGPEDELVCLEPLFKRNPDGTFELFEIRPCAHNKRGGFNV